MSEHKTFFGKLLAGIFGIFTSLFHVAKLTFDQLPADVQNAMIHGSGVIDLINAMLDKTPAEIRAAIAAKFPDLDEAKLESGLAAIAHAFNLAPATNSFEDVVTALKNYLASKTDAWATISHALSSALAAVFAPDGTKFSAIASLIEFVYQHFIKKQ